MEFCADTPQQYMHRPPTPKFYLTSHVGLSGAQGHPQREYKRLRRIRFCIVLFVIVLQRTTGGYDGKLLHQFCGYAVALRLATYNEACRCIQAAHARESKNQS